MPSATKHDLVGLDRRLERLSSSIMIGVDLQTARGVHDDHAIAVARALLDAGLGDLHHVRACAIGVHRHVELGAERLELIDGRGAVHVGGNQARALALGLELAGQLGRRGRLAGALQADHHDDRRRHGADA
jgi:hypothetical protein